MTPGPCPSSCGLGSAAAAAAAAAAAVAAAAVPAAAGSATAAAVDGATETTTVGATQDTAALRPNVCQLTMFPPTMYLVGTCGGGGISGIKEVVVSMLDWCMGRRPPGLPERTIPQPG
eukprot:CAMPEP_0183609446 /NCGR_PEP_ID=MMETSP0371-20130417/184466_1 /TAXON_ID=268820 /ORGANISM="Peridinium aciculiferum, Strain PAER-2" /LENGTH=117 /DNA_ID=CAMNT_0025821573 /DNA_START=234 /DNA_END=586 /DNA_ORIENTATION=+